MAELEKLKSDEKMYKSFGNLKISTEKALEGGYNNVKDIDRIMASLSAVGRAFGRTWHIAGLIFSKYK